jgi:hypothetical protein
MLSGINSSAVFTKHVLKQQLKLRWTQLTVFCFCSPASKWDTHLVQTLRSFSCCFNTCFVKTADELIPDNITNSLTVYLTS